MPKRDRVPRQKEKNISIKKRKTRFDEVPLGLTKNQALIEASRCLECKRPRCVDGCPVAVPIREFIKLIKEKKFVEASQKIKEKNALPAVCGRVCPQEDQCEKTCILGNVDEPVAIGKLEKFVADYEAQKEPSKESKDAGRKKDSPAVAVIGSGPAGLTCAADLAKLGYIVDIFEALHKPGGVLTYGIPEFRLPKAIVKREIEYIKSLGVNIFLNRAAGATFMVDELFKKYKAIFIGTGAGSPRILDIPGKNAIGVYTANEYLTRVNLMKAYFFPEYDTPVKRANKVIVIGGGNVAIDSARTALRTGAEKVTIAYRRTQFEMPGRIEEIEHAKEEGIKFEFLISPVELITDRENKVTNVKFQKMKLGKPDNTGRRRPVPLKNEYHKLEANLVIIAIGTEANPLTTKTIPGLELTKRGYIKVDKNLQTSIPGVFAGGDIITGAATVISAMGAGRKAAKSIHEFIKKKNKQ